MQEREHPEIVPCLQGGTITCPRKGNRSRARGGCRGRRRGYRFFQVQGDEPILALQECGTARQTEVAEGGILLRVGRLAGLSVCAWKSRHRAPSYRRRRLSCFLELAI